MSKKQIFSSFMHYVFNSSGPALVRKRQPSPDIPCQIKTFIGWTDFPELFLLY